jgi:hypothetical protein
MAERLTCAKAITLSILPPHMIPRQRLNDFLQVTGDYRDIDLVAGWSPRNPNTNGWLAAEASYGNGCLARLEHRQQYKLNGYRQFKFGRHELTFSGLAYYGFSFVPGLIPIQFPVPDDTIDNRQMDRTNNFLAAVADTWRVTPKSQFNFAAFFRDYHLTLRSNFGDGLIQQSENRTVLGGEVSYLQTVNEHFALLAGIELRRDGNASGMFATPSLVAPSRAYQLRFSKGFHQFEANLTLRRTSNSRELAKIDPDTGLQENFGPSLNRFVEVSLQRNFTHGAFYISYAQADARDTQTGQPVPEAPRLIWDAVASENHLPLGLEARGEFEFVRAKPLGDSLIGVPVYETRGAILRPFAENKMSLAVNFLIAKGYTGQTTETIPFQPQPCPTECIVGVPLKSFVALTYTYFFVH